MTANPAKENLLQIAAGFNPPGVNAADDPLLRRHCVNLFIDLRGYLIGGRLTVSREPALANADGMELPAGQLQQMPVPRRERIPQWTVPSQLPVARIVPSGENATLRILSVCPFRARIS